VPLDQLVDPSERVDRRLGVSDAHDLRVARLTSINALPPPPQRVNTTHQFKHGLHPVSARLFYGESHASPGGGLRGEPGPRGEAGPAAPAFYETSSDSDDEEGEVDEAELEALDTAPHFASCGFGGAFSSSGAHSSGDGGEEASCEQWHAEVSHAHDASMASALTAEMASFQSKAFGGCPPGWLVEAALHGCHTLDQVAATTSLEHQGPIDALSADASTLAEYNRWLLAASKRIDYLKERSLEASRESKVAADRASHARRGAALQQAAWSQRGQAIEERKNVARLNHLKARGAKKEAAARRADARVREARWAGHVAALHSEVADLPEDVRQAKALLTHHRHVGARTIKAAAGAIEKRKSELQQQRESEARAMRDRVRASSTVSVPAEVAHAITCATGATATGSARGSSNPCTNPSSARSVHAPSAIQPGYRVLSNPDSVLVANRPARSGMTPRATSMGIAPRSGGTSGSAATPCPFDEGREPLLEA